MYLELACIVTLYTAGVAACLGLHRMTKSRNEWRDLYRIVVRDRDQKMRERDDAEREKRRLQEMCSEYAGQVGAVCEERDEYRRENEKLRRVAEKARSKWAN